MIRRDQRRRRYDLKFRSFDRSKPEFVRRRLAKQFENARRYRAFVVIRHNQRIARGILGFQSLITISSMRESTGARDSRSVRTTGWLCAMMRVWGGGLRFVATGYRLAKIWLSVEEVVHQLDLSNHSGYEARARVK